LEVTQMQIASSTVAVILLFGTATAYARQEDGNGQEEHQQNAMPEHQPTGQARAHRVRRG